MNHENLETKFGMQNGKGDYFEIIDPRSEFSNKAKPHLNGSWGQAAASFLMIPNECLRNHDLVCGSADIRPSRRLRKLFGAENRRQVLRVTVVLEEPEKDGSVKVAQIMAKIGSVVVGFGIKSINGSEGNQRQVSQTTVKEGIIKKIEETDGKSEAWKNYGAVMETIKGVSNWKKPTDCGGCSDNYFDYNSNGELLESSGSS